MLQRFRAAGLVWPSLAALAGLAVLIGLGSWQLQRKQWKDRLIAQIESRIKAPPMALDRFVGAHVRAPLQSASGGAALDPSAEYTRIRVGGPLLRQHQRHLYAPDQRLGPGYHLYVPLVSERRRLVIVNLGFIPQQLKSPAARPDGARNSTVEVVGLVRLPGRQGLFTPNHDVKGNSWYWRDLDGMAVGLPPGSTVLPFFIDAQTIAPAVGPWPKPGVTRLRLPNRHLEYAVTWFGLAATLIGVFLVFAVGRWRQPRDPQTATAWRAG